jgi:prepilin-type N-terminal cleavage/methylation domain-containing protein
MFSDRGFTLIETLVAGTIGTILVLALGLLGEDLSRRRISADSSSAATTIAEHTMEQLLAVSTPATDSRLSAGLHGPCASPPCLVGPAGGTASSSVTLNGPFRLQWNVADNTPTSTGLVDPDSSTKKITVTVTHVTNRYARAELQTYTQYK